MQTAPAVPAAVGLRPGYVYRFELSGLPERLGHQEAPPALYALAPDCVLHIGSFSKSLAPALRLGYLIGGWDMMRRLLPLKGDSGTGALDQMVVAEYFSQNFDRHLGHLNGVLRGKLLHVDKFESAVEGGFGFCDVVLGWDMHDQTYDNTTLTGWHHGYPDANVAIDLSSHRTIPWDNGVHFFLGNFVDKDGSPHALCPRQQLRRVLARCEKMGFAAMVGSEYEFFNFAETPATWAGPRMRASESGESTTRGLPPQSRHLASTRPAKPRDPMESAA